MAFLGKMGSSVKFLFRSNFCLTAIDIAKLDTNRSPSYLTDLEQADIKICRFKYLRL